MSSSKCTYCCALIVLCRCVHFRGDLVDIVHRRSQCRVAGGQCTEHLENTAYLHTWMSRLVCWENLHRKETLPFRFTINIQM